MKKCILILSFLTLTLGLSAQVYVGGNVSFSATAIDQTVDNTTTEVGRTTSFSILPEAGYFLADDLSVGGKVGISLQRQNTNPGGDDNISSLLRFHISPYVRKYFSLGDKLYLYGEGGVSFATGTEKNTVGGTTSDGPTVTDFSVAIAPGMEYKVSDRFAVNMDLGGLGYTIHKTTSSGNPETITKDKRFYFNAGFDNLSFGVKYYLNMGASTSE